MFDPMLHLLAAVFFVLSVLFLVLAVRALRRRQLVRGSGSLLLGLLLLSLSALSATISVSTRGYKALTHEEVAAVVQTVPAGDQLFLATFRFPSGEVRRFRMAGDELYVDAHILKWKPIANVLGLHTAYELDRVAGRYVRLEDERTRPRTVASLAEDKPIDMFELRRRLPLLRPLVDAEYGSGTFVLADAPASYEIRVSVSGLLVRRVGGK